MGPKREENPTSATWGDGVQIKTIFEISLVRKMGDFNGTKVREMSDFTGDKFLLFCNDNN